MGAPIAELCERMPPEARQAQGPEGFPSGPGFAKPRAAARQGAMVLRDGTGLIEPFGLCQRTRLTPTLLPVSMSCSSKKPSQLRVMRTRGFGAPL